MSAVEFAQAQSKEQLLVFFRPEERTRLLHSRFPLAVAESVNRRFRANELIRRAKKHKRPGRQMLTLLRRAVLVDPCYSIARDIYHRRAHQADGYHEPIPNCVPPGD